MYYFYRYAEGLNGFEKTLLRKFDSPTRAIVELMQYVTICINSEMSLDNDVNTKKALSDKLYGIFTDTNETPISFDNGNLKFFLVKKDN